LSGSFWTLDSAAAAAAGAVDDDDARDDGCGGGDGGWTKDGDGASRQNRTSTNPATTKTRYDPISFSTAGGAQLTVQ